MDAALIASAGLLGLVGAPHCAAMCGAPCSALARRCGGGSAAWAGFLGGRMVGYIAAGAAVAAGVALLNALGNLAPALRPLWAALHLLAFGIGAWMLITGALPAWFAQLGAPARSAQPAAGGAERDAAGWQPMAGPLRAAGAGSLWVALPCGLLQSALVVAALASTPLQGAAAMAAFAATSSLGLAVLPLAWARGVEVGTLRWAVRASGALLIVGSGWALGHGLWQRMAAFCGLA